MTDKIQHHKLAPIGVSGTTWEVTVDESGYFRAKHPAHGEVHGYSYEAVTEKARKASATGRVKVSVPYARVARSGRLGAWRVVRGEATGIHGSTGNVLLREGGKSSQGTSTYDTRDYFRPPTPEQEAELIRLLNEKDAIDKAYNELKGQLAFPGGIAGATRDAVDKAATAG